VSSAADDLGSRNSLGDVTSICRKFYDCGCHGRCRCHCRCHGVLGAKPSRQVRYHDDNSNESVVPLLADSVSSPHRQTRHRHQRHHQRHHHGGGVGLLASISCRLRLVWPLLSWSQVQEAHVFQTEWQTRGLPSGQTTTCARLVSFLRPCASLISVMVFTYVVCLCCLSVLRFLFLFFYRATPGVCAELAVDRCTPVTLVLLYRNGKKIIKLFPRPGGYLL